MEDILMSSVQNTTNIVVNEERRGLRVSTTLFDGSVVERIVWDEDVEENVVYLCTTEGFSRLSRGDEGTRPVGFPASSVRWEK
jgi:polygalacturonase